MRANPLREWATAALAALDRGPAALVTVLATAGSVPREAGTRMVVWDGGIHGTIGGGALEHQAIDQARRLLGGAEGAWRVQDYPLGPLLGQCCGGRVRLVIERLGDRAWLAAVRDGAAGLEWAFGPSTIDRHPREGRRPSPHRSPRHCEREEAFRRRAGDGAVEASGTRPAAGDGIVETFDDRTPVALFGGGHVGRALAPILATLPFQLGWYDAREDAAPATIVPEAALLDLARGAEGPVAIMTHDHGLDYRLTAAALGGASPFVGLIGSATKRARFLSRLAKDGFGEAAIARVHCPIGLDGIRGKEPAVIAVAVAAQLLALRS